MLGLWEGSHHPGSPPDDKELLCMGCFSKAVISKENMNKKVYVANLPYQATESKSKLFSPEPEASCLSRLSKTGKPVSEGHCLRGDEYAMGRPKSRLHAQSPGLHGKEPAGKRSNGKNGASEDDRGRNLKNHINFTESEAL